MSDLDDYKQWVDEQVNRPESIATASAHDPSKLIQRDTEQATQ